MLPISDILIRSISGYVFIFPVLILYFSLLKKWGRKQNLIHIVTVFLFCYYLFGILTVTGIGYTSTMSFRPRISLIPFLSMISGPIDTILNVVLFVPFGFFLPLLYKKYRNIRNVILTGFLFSLSVEIVQMFDWGATDINDLITNTAGVCLGYLAYYLLSKVLPDNLRKQFQSNNVNDVVVVLLFAIYIFIIMVTVQPWVIHSLLNIE
ncbi:VanZ family protein [[Clostridium] hylemonae]|uniref:VanZ family protein n=1 Tax=[Clostridium] hylemonae TaxID=89153 RepID=UPI001D061683|nr:VanZ family protein [[Clostridium] hylemonae]MCB7523197.1 VanZ family protein [[Clostridium] hylemonae]